MHPKALGNRGSSWKEDVFNTVVPCGDFGVDSMFEAVHACSMVEFASTLN